uniref:Uncharacterized protein n=1 Tax=Streptomyces globisporus TaxID=1908 RepID=Q8GMD7_STRGL|nr:hypothetical protein [Streptomyces globisporus]
MASVPGSLRRLLMAPSLADVSFAGRGFPVVETAATRQLETIPQTVVTGFEWGIESKSLWETERRLSLVDEELRGFAYEGATMASVIRDSMPGRGGRTAELLQGAGRRHIFLNYIGIGFAMAKLPRPLWKKAVPALDGDDLYPSMSWLAVDGYGFDRAYFAPERWVDEQRLDTPYGWEDRPGYFQRAGGPGHRASPVVHPRRRGGCRVRRGQPVRLRSQAGPVGRCRARGHVRRLLHRGGAGHASRPVG